MSLTTAVTRFTAAVKLQLQVPLNTKNMLLRRTNKRYVGRPVVSRISIAWSQTEVDAMKAVTTAPVAPILDIRSYTLWTWNGAAWTSTLTNFSAMTTQGYFNIGWLVLSPADNRYYSISGATSPLRRLA